VTEDRGLIEGYYFVRGCLRKLNITRGVSEYAFVQTARLPKYLTGNRLFWDLCPFSFQDYFNETGSSAAVCTFNVHNSFNRIPIVVSPMDFCGLHQEFHINAFVPGKRSLPPIYRHFTQ
jgi:hypothetical protein